MPVYEIFYILNSCIHAVKVLVCMRLQTQTDLCRNASVTYLTIPDQCLITVFALRCLEGSSFALQDARPLRGSDDFIKWRSRLQ